MNELWSVRCYNGEFRGPFDPNLVQYSVYPFDDLLNFKLHVPYHFVIVNTGKKLFQLYGLDEIDFERDFSFLQGEDFVNTRTIMMIMRNIYIAWNLAKPDSRWLTGVDYNEANQDPSVDRTPQEGAKSDSGGQDRGGPSGSTGSGSQAQNIAAVPSGGQMEQ